MNTMKGLAWRTARLWALARLYWGTEDCDWSTIALLMRHQIRRTREHVTEHDHIVGTERISRQMLIAETLLTRMLDEPYSANADARYPEGGKHWAELIRDVGKQDDEMLATLLRRHFRGWWD